MSASTVILWFRRDLRLSDHPALWAAANAGLVIPLFIRDQSVDGLGAAAKWRLGEGLRVFGEALEDRGLKLILRRGNARDVLREVIEETGATEVHWSRLYDPEAIERDTDVKSALKEAGIVAESHPGHLIFEPWTVETQTGGPYKVYSPFWRAVKDRDVDEPLPTPDLTGPESWPDSDDLADWALGADMNRGAGVLAKYCNPGERAATSRLGSFVAQKIDAYKADRDLPAEDATSRMSEYLTYGEISPRQLWAAGARAMDAGKAGAEHYLKEVVWREFAYHLLYHFPQMLTENWREGWDDFPWREDERLAEVKAWKQGRTGVPFVDAALREMYVTGYMHNRARMIVASYLTKHCMIHWRVGQAWFDDCLTDWDPASNAMGWQWVAGCGPDAAPYFRVFNPETQGEKFDPKGTYQKRWIAEGQTSPPETATDYFEAIPRSWKMEPGGNYPREPVVGLKEGREAALAAYEARPKASDS
ncbi:deoxyribodipyrimidine photo-lyase [Maritimibacter alkaliphilus HTCC2654]|uniref:Deoxyribodipyrimidine photolyase n=1 Tax=Maritimibacter alkaliphilus HTCC2654 TaxID=314271 RepID=A3VDI3_9RHOB|nr:deoxyribodipyrimidine photo-lyase [Maritimibacter alkaliphilus]EAQ13572.1 deoxyribodipyrimidine photolyase [Maritimibacter alkaliphilus HTCC2654]TYP83413.1 deoxyribodipyrimidine photo-lyase [Maritimibacter alkaliphilus HTCC2654]